VNDREHDGLTKKIIVISRARMVYAIVCRSGPIFVEVGATFGRADSLVLAYVQVAQYQLGEYLCIRFMCLFNSDTFEKP